MPDEGVVFNCMEVRDDVLEIGGGEVGGPGGGGEAALSDSVELEGGLRSTGVATDD